MSHLAQIVIEDLCKTLGGIHTLNKVSICVGHNELVVVLGPSGCGKSTLLHIIAGLIAPDSGRVLIDGVDWSGRTGRAGYMQQKDLLLDSRNILDNICIPLLLQGMDKKTARIEIEPYIEEFGLAGFENFYPRQLSGGMRQRAALLRTYLFSREILLLDEPFAALDAINRRRMQVWLKGLHLHYRSSIIFVTHDIEEALVLADRIYVFTARPARVGMEVDLQAGGDSDQAWKQDILAFLEE